MNYYDCYLSYSRFDRDLALQLALYLKGRGVIARLDEDITYGEDLKESIERKIRESDFMIVLLTHKSITSYSLSLEVNYALQLGSIREKTIIPVVIDDVDISSVSFATQLTSSKLNFIRADSKDPCWPGVLDRPLDEIQLKNKKARYYEELSELTKANLYLKAIDKLTEIVDTILDQIYPTKSLRAQHLLVLELDQSLNRIHSFYDEYCYPDYSKEARTVAQHKLDMLNKIKGIKSDFTEEKQDLFYVSSMLRLIYWDREIRLDCASLITNGDAYNNASGQGQHERQQELRDLFILRKPKVSEESEVIQNFIQGTEKYLYPANKRETKTDICEKTNTVVPSEQSQKLETIAKYIREGNYIFELIGEDEKATAFLRCLITSYERLKNYCSEIGASDLVAECISRIPELKDKVRKLDDSTLKDHSTAERSIRALLGFSRPGTGDYDVFLSHRGHDTDIARNVYGFLKTMMKEVFFDDVSLSEELSDTDYKNAIYHALDKAKHFVVIITDLNELEPGYQKHDKDWMQLEMDVFHTELIEGRKKNANFIIIVPDELEKKIVGSNKTNIDIKWRSHSLIKLSEFQEKLIGYLSK